MPAATSHVPLLPRSGGGGRRKTSTAAKKSAATVAEDAATTAKDAAAPTERATAALPITTAKQVSAPPTRLCSASSVVKAGVAAAAATGDPESAPTVSPPCCKAEQHSSKAAAVVAAAAAAAHPLVSEQQPVVETAATTAADTLPFPEVRDAAEAVVTAVAEEPTAAAMIPAGRFQAELGVFSSAAEKETTSAALAGKSSAEAAPARRAEETGQCGNEGFERAMRNGEPAAEAPSCRATRVAVCPSATERGTEFTEAGQLRGAASVSVPTHSCLLAACTNTLMAADGEAASARRRSDAARTAQEAVMTRRERAAAAGEEDDEEETDTAASVEKACATGEAQTAGAETGNFIAPDDAAASNEREADGPSERLSPFLDASLREQLERRGLMPCSLADVLRRRGKEWARTQLISAEVQPEKERLDALFKRQCEGWGNNQEGWIHGRWCSVIFCPDFRQGGLQVSRTGRRKLWDRLKQTVEGWVDPSMQICEVLDSTHPVRFATPPEQSCYTVVYVGEPIPANKQSRVVFGEYTGAVLRNSAARKSFEYVFDLSFCALAWRKAEEFETASDSSDDEVPFSAAHSSLDDAVAAPAAAGTKAGGGGDLLLPGELEAAHQPQHSREKKKQLVAASGRKDSRGLTRVQLPARSEFVLDSSSCCNELSLVNHYGTIELLGDRVERRNAEWQQVFVDGWPHIVLTSIPGVGVRRGDELLADFGNEWFHKVQDAAHAQIAQELLRYRLRFPPPQPHLSAAAPPPRLFPDRPFSCIDRRADPLLRSRARRGEICPYCHCDELPQQQEDLEEPEQSSQQQSPQQPPRQQQSTSQQQQPTSQQQQQQAPQQQWSQQQSQQECQLQQEEPQRQPFGDEVVHCDGCDRPCHLRCLPDGAATLNEWKWYCAICRMQFFEMARNMDYQVLVPAQEAQAAAAASGTLPFCDSSSWSGGTSRDAIAAVAAGGLARAGAVTVVAAGGGAAGGAAAGAKAGGGAGEARRVLGHLQQLQQEGPREGDSSTGSTTTPSLHEEDTTDTVIASPQAGPQQQEYNKHQPETGRGTEAACSLTRQLKESLKKPAAVAATAGGSCSHSSNISTAKQDQAGLLQQRQQQQGNHPSSRCSPRLLQQPAVRNSSNRPNGSNSNSSSGSTSRGDSGRRVTPEITEKEKKRVAVAGLKTEGCAAAGSPSKRIQQQMAASPAAATVDPSRMHRDAACGDRSSKTDAQRRSSKPGTPDQAVFSSSSCSAAVEPRSAVNGGESKATETIQKEWPRRTKQEEGKGEGREERKDDIAKQQQQKNTTEVVGIQKGRHFSVSSEDRTTIASEVRKCRVEKNAAEYNTRDDVPAVAEGGFSSGDESGAAAAVFCGENAVPEADPVLDAAGYHAAATAEDARPSGSSGDPARREAAEALVPPRAAAADTRVSHGEAAGELAEASGSKGDAAPADVCLSYACGEKEAAAGESALHNARRRKAVVLTDAEAATLSWKRFSRPPSNVSETRRVCESTDACAAAGRMQASRAGLVGLHTAELQGLQSHVPMPPRFLLGSLRPCMHCHRLLGARASTEVCRLARRHLAPSWDHPHQAASPVLLREAILTAFQEKLTSLQREMKSRMHALQKELRKARAAAAANPAATTAGAAAAEGSAERNDKSSSMRNSYAGQFLTAAAAEFLSFAQQKTDDHTSHSDVWSSSRSNTPGSGSSSSKGGNTGSKSGSHKIDTRVGSAQRSSASPAGTAMRTLSPLQATCSPLLQQWKKRNLAEGGRPLPSLATTAGEGEIYRSPAARKATAGKAASSFTADAAAAANGQLLERLFQVPPVQKVGFVPLLGVYLGKTYVDRHFEQGWFAGRVVDYSPLTIEEDGRWYSNLFRIQYEDGDEEFFRAEDLLELLSTHAVRRWESCSSNVETDETHPHGGTATGGGGKHFYKTTTLDRLLAPGVKAARLELNARVRRLRMLEEADGRGGKAAAADREVASVKAEQEQLKKRRREGSS